MITEEGICTRSKTHYQGCEQLWYVAALPYVQALITSALRSSPATLWIKLTNDRFTLDQDQDRGGDGDLEVLFDTYLLDS